MKAIQKIILCLLALAFTQIGVQAKEPPLPEGPVKKFLDLNQQNWRDLNVPYQDGRLLYQLVLKHNYKNVLEIGTSTGHSSIWLAWALAQTGGKLTTIEIDPGRYNIAKRNFKKAGLTPYIKQIRGNAHRLVKNLPGPYDMVFCDADKSWYRKYFRLVHPKLKRGGIFAAHNVLNRELYGITEFMEFLKTRHDYQTVIDRGSSSGTSISKKK